MKLVIHQSKVLQHVVAQQRLWGGTGGQRCVVSQHLVTFFALSRALNTCVNPRASCSALEERREGGGREAGAEVQSKKAHSDHNYSHLTQFLLSIAPYLSLLVSEHVSE